MEIKLLKTFSLILIFIFHSLFFAQNIKHSEEDLNRSDSISIDNSTKELLLTKFTKEQIENVPIRETKDLLKFFPGLTTYQDQFHLRGSRSDEIAYTLNGAPITDLFSGDQLLYIPLNIIDEVQLFSGSQPITISNSGSGIIEYKLKSGGDKLEFDFEQTSDNMGFNRKSNAYSGNERLGAYWYGYSESNLSIGGPIFNTPIKFYVNCNYKFMRDKNPQRYPGIDNLLLVNESNPTHDSLLLDYPAGIVYGNSIQKYNIYGSLYFDFNLLKIKVMGIYDSELQDVDRNHITSLLNNRIGKNEKENIFLSVKATHKLSSILSYNFQASYTSNSEETYDPYLKDNFWDYGDSVANANVGVIWDRSDAERSYYTGLSPEYTRYIAPSSRNFYGFSFQKDGTPPINYSKLNQVQFSVAGNFIIRLFQNNTIKIGGSYRQGILRKWETQMFNHSSFASNLANSLTRNNHGTEKEEKANILIHNGVNNYGYDIFGNLSDDGFDAPHKPSFVNLFVEESFLYKDFFLKLGLTYDYIDIENFILTDPTRPENSFDDVLTYSNDALINYNDRGFKDSPSYSYFSPRLNASYKVNNSFLIKAHYGHYIKQSKLEDSYNSLSSLRYKMYFSGFFSAPIENYLEPTISKLLGLNITYNFNQKYSIKLNGYINNLSNQQMFSIQETDVNSPVGSYVSTSNEGNSEINGIEVIFSLSPINNLSILSNFSYMSSSTNVLSSEKNMPLGFEKPFSSNLSISYLFNNLSYLSSFFHKLQISTLVTYNEGHPYYRSKANDLISSQPNNLLQFSTPNNFQVNFRMDKTIEIYNKVNLNFYIYAINIFNNENILDVFLRTGSAKTNGYLEDPELGGRLIEAYGENYAELYKLINYEYLPRSTQFNMYGEPRQIIMGIKLNL
ncbi:MAG: TonB-dependent receptor plug domain-containing protein [Ignavibacteriae bacterium]|nr:TonB-dependent receptor plug domain-containing protein [Ignavibacteriota bacterium]